MDVVILLVFISLGLVAASLLFFVHRLREGDFDHGDRLALAPLDDDPQPSANDDDATEPAGAGRTRNGEAPSVPPEGNTSSAPIRGNHSSDEPQGGSPHARC